MYLSTSSLEETIKLLDYSLQPIVNVHSGVVYGFEALIDGVKQTGFSCIGTFLDAMHRQRALPLVYQLLLKKAFDKFQQIPWSDQVKLFFNLDGRLLGNEYPEAAWSFKQAGLSQQQKGQICFEISEQYDLDKPELFVTQLQDLRLAGCKVAVDDFGTGFAGNHLLYHAKPEYVKIDRFYIENIESDSYKRMLASSMVNMAHFVGSYVIAEGIETEKEFYLCKTIGFDLVQGHLIGKPELEIDHLCREYLLVQNLAAGDKRQGKGEDKTLLQNELEYIEPINNDTKPIVMLEVFKSNTARTFFPVINQNREAQGIIREATVKEYAYSKYGRYLLANPTSTKTVESFMDRIPIVDIHTPIDRILDIFASNDKLEGVLITNKSEYQGILSAQSLLRIINEKKIANAVDQNPLSGLPGNRVIFEYISKALQNSDVSHVIAYFDFDNFKIYNDTYGFRQGDRVIMLFAELLKASAQCNRRFIGHIGGDDFFMGAEDVELLEFVEEIMSISGRFARHVQSFYSQDAVRRGGIKGVDRDGEQRCFPLMSISSAVLSIAPGLKRIFSPEEIGKTMAEMKKKAKNSNEKLYVTVLGEDQ